jgi:uncharacterized protein
VSSSNQNEIVDNQDANRFEIRADGELAGFAEYRLDLDSKSIEFVHTEIDPNFGGRGLGGALVRAVLDSARQRNLAVLPHCSFVRGWISKHADYEDLVPADRRAEFEL